ncbi:unnamed protein product [Amoebophrya sp. A120]|nr:unnamed protein product [Amoebophrya sp. A120]|eukprot:GSA120T00017289001.1
MPTLFADRRPQVERWLSEHAPNAKVVSSYRREISRQSCAGISLWIGTMYGGGALYLIIGVLLFFRRWLLTFARGAGDTADYTEERGGQDALSSTSGLLLSPSFYFQLDLFSLFLTSLVVTGYGFRTDFFLRNFPKISEKIERYIMVGCNKYFGCVVIAEDPAEFRRLLSDQTQAVMVGLAPHDVLPLACCGLAPICLQDSLNLAENKPGVVIAATESIQLTPLWNQLAYLLHARSVGKKQVVRELKSGKKLALVPGGVQEVLWNYFYKQGLEEKQVRDLQQGHDTFFAEMGGATGVKTDNTSTTGSNKAESCSSTTAACKKEESESTASISTLTTATTTKSNSQVSLVSSDIGSGGSTTSCSPGKNLSSASSQTETSDQHQQQKNKATIFAENGKKDAEQPLNTKQDDFTILYLQNRKGFVKLAIEQKAAVVPIFAFGQEAEFSFLAPQPPESFPKLRRLFSEFSRKIGFAPIIPLGIGKIPFGIPNSCPLGLVIGKPIVGTNVDAVHAEYCREIVRIGELYGKCFTADKNDADFSTTGAGGKTATQDKGRVLLI